MTKRKCVKSLIIVILLIVIPSTAILITYCCRDPFPIKKRLENDRDLLLSVALNRLRKGLNKAIEQNDNKKIEAYKYSIKRREETLDFLNSISDLPEPYMDFAAFNDEINTEKDGSFSVRLSLSYHEDGFDVTGLKLYFSDSEEGQSFSFPVLQNYYSQNDMKDFADTTIREVVIRCIIGDEMRFVKERSFADKNADLVKEAYETRHFDRRF